MSKRVLIVDADGEVQARCRQILAAEGFQVVGVAGGKQGLAALERERFDLLVVDYHMQDMHAGVFVRTVVGRHPQLPQALLTAPANGWCRWSACPCCPSRSPARRWCACSSGTAGTSGARPTTAVSA